MKHFSLGLFSALILSTSLLAAAPQAEARGYFYGSIGVGGPYYYSPYYAYQNAYYPPYGYPAPVYAAPAPAYYPAPAYPAQPYAAQPYSAQPYPVQAYAPPPDAQYGHVVVNDGTHYCREYTRSIMVAGQKQLAHGEACRQPDGSWRIVN